MWLKLLRVGPRGWLELTEAQLCVLQAHLVLRLRPRGQLVSTPHETPPHETPTESASAEVDAGKIDAAVTAIARVASHGLTRPRCLVRSIALQRMLQARGITGVRVRFGVRRVNEEFQSHAWVELDGRVIGDDPRHVRSFEPMDELWLDPSGPRH